MNLHSKKMRNSYLLTAVLFIAAGIILLTWPETTMNVICYGLGGLIFIYGAFQIYTYYNGRTDETNYRMNLLMGLIACGIGLFMLLKSDIVMSILPFIIGCTLLLEAAVKGKYAMDLKKAGYDGFQWIMAIAVVTLILAGLLLYNPFQAAVSMVMFIGICLVFVGCTELWTLYCARKYMYQEDAASIHVEEKKEMSAASEDEKNTSAKFVDIKADDIQKDKGTDIK